MAKAVSPIHAMRRFFTSKRTSELSTPGLNAVTIDVLPAMDGFGDLMNAYRLAEGIRQTGQVQTIRFLFESAYDLQRLKQIIPDIPDHVDTLERFTRNGLIFINGEKVNKEAILAESKVNIVTSLMIDQERGGEKVVARPGAINIYLQEYDSSTSILGRFSRVARVFLGPQEKDALKENKIVKDRKGRLHWVVPTGFSSEVGINIAEDIKDTHLITDRNEIIRKLQGATSFHFSPSMAHDRWSLVYYDEYEKYREQYEDHLITAIEGGKVKPEDISIFDISSVLKAPDFRDCVNGSVHLRIFILMEK